MRVVDDGLENVGRAVLDVDGAWIGQVVGPARRIPVDVAFDGARIRIEEQLSWVAAHALVGRIWSVDPIAVALAWSDVRKVDVPGEGIDLLESNPAFFAGIVEEAQVDGFGDFGKQREVRAYAVKRRSQGIGAARPNFSSTGKAIRHAKSGVRRSRRSKGESWEVGNR